MLKWYYYVLFGVVALIALSMTWWSMFDLSVNTMSAPVLLAAGGSLLFDLAGIYLIVLSIKYAMTDDSGFWTELGAYAFIAASTWIIYQHGILEGYPFAGVIFFAAAPVVLGVVLKATLQYVTRQQRRKAGRVTDRLPSVGWLTWVRYFPQTWKLMSVAMQGRLISAADKLTIPEDRHAIFVGQAEVQKVPAKAPEIKQELPVPRTPELVHVPSISQDLIPVRTEEDIDEIVYTGDIVSLPEWLPKEPTMTLGRIAEICVENNVIDTLTILQWAKDIKHSDVKYGSMYKAVQRARQKV